jgi:type IV secretory pathway TrbD component
MNADELDLDAIHPSLTQPVLWGGVERRVVALEFVVVVLLVTWKGIVPFSVVLALVLVLPLHLAARRIARIDPRMFDLFLRSLAWRRYYPPHASIQAATPPVKPSIPGAR